MAIFKVAITRAESWAQPKCPSMGKWINKKVYTYSRVLLGWGVALGTALVLTDPGLNPHH